MRGNWRDYISVSALVLVAAAIVASFYMYDAAYPRLRYPDSARVVNEGVESTEDTSPIEAQIESTPDIKPTPKLNLNEPNAWVYITKNGERYHKENGCGSTPKGSMERITQGEASKRGYTPCKRCIGAG